MEITEEKTGVLEQRFHMLPEFLQEHSVRVGWYAEILVGYIRANRETGYFKTNMPPLLHSLPAAEQLGPIGRYHDIGKAAITDVIWKCPRQLTKQERELIVSHTVFGGYLIRGTAIPPCQEPEVPTLWDTIAQCCQYHHENWDGSGYPFGLCGNETPLLARVIRVADSYDAMTADRPYHKGIDPKQALEEIERNAGRQFDPVLAELFCAAVQQETAAGLINKETSMIRVKHEM